VIPTKLNKIIQEDIEFIINHNLDWDKFSDSTVLISGANGFLPAYMVETLLYLNEKQNKNIKIIALVRNKEKAFKKFEHHKNRKDLKFLVQDVCEPIKIKPEENIDFIIHAASQASPKYFGKDPVGTLSANTIGTINLLKIAQEKSSKGFLFFSGGEVYGIVDDNKIPTKEKDFGYLDPTDVRSCYAESKRMGENICVSWFHQYGIPTKIIRLYHTYGPGMDFKDGRVFADFVSDVINNNNIVMKSDGSATRAFCYLADAVLGFFTVLLKGKNGEAYNLGFDKETSIIELANILVNLFPEKNLKVIKNEHEISKEYLKSKINRGCPDISKIKILGWEPKYSINEGLKRTILSYYENN
jgi:nucleoside-diphosphate-sugar epimerase